MGLVDKYCNKCHKPVTNSARFCPYCGGKLVLSTSSIVLIVILSVFGLGFVSVVFPGFNANLKRVGTALSDAGNALSSKDKSTTSSSGSDKSTKQKETYGIGESCLINDFNVMVLSAGLSSGNGSYNKPDDGKVYLGLVVELYNHSDKDTTVSSILSLDAYCDDYAVSQSYLAPYTLDEWKDYESLNGTIATGKRLKGVVVYEVPEGFKKFELMLKPDLTTKQKAKFVVKRDECDTSGLESDD